MNRDYQSLFIKLCQWNYLDDAKLLISLKPDIDISANDYFVFSSACTNGHLNVIKWLLSIEPISTIPIYKEYFINACENGYLDIAKFFIEIRPEFKTLSNIYDIFYTVCHNGHLDVAKWILNEIKPKNINDYISVIFKTVCTTRMFKFDSSGNNRLDVAKWLFKIKPDLDTKSVFCDACLHNNYDIAKWLFEITPDIDTKSAFRDACLYNNYDIAKLLFEITPNIDNLINDTCDENIFRHICYKNYLDIAKLFIKINPNKYVINIVNNKIVKYDIIIKLTENDQKLCYICNNPVKYQTNCKHNFCEECTNKIFNISDFEISVCPYCNTDVICTYECRY